MKICMISHDFRPNVGGVASHVYHLSRVFTSMGHEVVVLTIRYSSRVQFHTQADCGTVIRFLVPKVRKMRGLWFSIIGSMYLARLDHSFDVVHWHNFLPDSLIAYSAKARVKIFTNHTSQFIEAVRDGRSLRILRWCVSRADAIIGPSRELAELSARHLGKPAYYIPNGVDLRLYAPASVERRVRVKVNILRKLGLSSERDVILCPRRLEPKNGVEYLIQAVPAIVKKYPSVVILIVGNDADPHYARRLRRLTRDLGLEKWVIFVGPVHPNGMVSLYHASDIVVIPSLIEAVSIAALEAMSCGIPVVASNVGGLRDIVLHGETGFLFEKGDSQGLAEHVCQLLDNEALREELGHNARELVSKKFSWEIVAKETLRVYQGRH